MGAAAAAHLALERVHAPKTNSCSISTSIRFRAGVGATDFPGEGGLSLNEVRECACVCSLFKPNLQLS